MVLENIRISNISVVVKIYQPADRIKHFENRANYGLLFVESGELFYEQNGVRYISDGNHALFIPKGIDYSLCCVSESYTYVINFDLCIPIDFDTIQLFTPFPTERIIGFLERMERTWNAKGSGYHFRCMSVLYRILARLYDNSPAHDADIVKRERIQPSVYYLEQNFLDPEISNDIVAGQSGISTIYFRKLFKEVYGISPMQHVTALRIEKAQDMLQSGYYTVTETAEAVGFNSICNFNRAFKQIVGMPPSKYLQQFLK